MQKVETELMVLTKESDGVVVGRERNFDIPRTVERVEEAISAAKRLSDGQTCAALWDMRGSPRPQPESWRLFISRIPDVFHALAIVVDEGARAALGAFPVAIDNLLVPVRLFEDETEARQWLTPHAQDRT